MTKLISNISLLFPVQLLVLVRELLNSGVGFSS